MSPQVELNLLQIATRALHNPALTSWVTPTTPKFALIVVPVWAIYFPGPVMFADLAVIFVPDHHHRELHNQAKIFINWKLDPVSAAADGRIVVKRAFVVRDLCCLLYTGA